jgi:hypothetical protein
MTYNSFINSNVYTGADSVACIQLWSLHEQCHQLSGWGLFLCFTCLHVPYSTVTLITYNSLDAAVAVCIGSKERASWQMCQTLDHVQEINVSCWPQCCWKTSCFMAPNNTQSITFITVMACCHAAATSTWTPASPQECGSPSS